MKYSTRCKVALTLMLTLCLGFTSARGAIEASPDSIRYHELDDVGKVPTKKSTKPIKTSASQLSGKYYAQWDNIQSTNGRKGFTSMVYLTITDDGVATMTNFYNLGSDVVLTGTYDESTSTLTFPCQKLYTLSPYGDFNLCYFDADRYGFSTSIPVRFTINSDGILESESGWVILITDSSSSYYGVGQGMSYKARYYESNAKMSGNIRDIDNLTFNAGEYPLYVYNSAEGELTVANFSSQGREVVIMLNSDKSVYAEPQVMVYYSLTSAAYCLYPAEWSSTKNKSKGLDKNLTGTGTDNSITFGPWGIFRSTALTTCLFGMESSQILLNDGVTIAYPSSDAITFEGAGTEESPYLISSAADLSKLAKAVNAGETYSGKYFRQTADIDYSTYTGSVHPIGQSATVYFDGIYDGDSKEIKSLNLERGTSAYSGLFGYCGENSILKNIKITVSTLSTYGKYNGLLAGYTLGSVENCHATGTVTGRSDYVGGLIGQSVNVSNSSFVGYVTGVGYTGGLIGCVNKGHVTNCHVEGKITTSISSTSISHAVGGVVGSLIGATGNIGLVQDCYFMGSAYDTSGYAHLGGVVGTVSNYSRVARCVGLGMLSTAVKSSSVGSCGGVVGSNSYGSIIDCYAANEIIGTTDCNKVGGIVGLISYYSTYAVEVRRSIFAGEIVLAGTITTDYGIYGKYDNEGAAITDNYYDAQVLGGDIEGSGKSTADLISGTMFENYSADDWSFAAGRYPILKSFPESLIGYATVPLILSGNQKSRNVKKDFTLGTAEGVIWSLLDSSGSYVDETDALKIEGNTVKIKNQLSFEYVVARITTDNGTFTRLYYLSISPAQFEGDGSESNPYLIKTVDDLRTLNSSITGYNQTYEGDYLRLANDIDLTGVTDFWGVGDDSNVSHIFNGIFDGDGHSIKNWTASGLVLDATTNKASASLSRSTVALFGMAGPKSVIKNVTIDSSCSISGYAGCAGIVAITSGKVENCRNYADITIAYYYTAGIAARSTGGSIVNCYNAGTITSGGKYPAGILSDMQDGSTISGCQNDGIVRTAKVSETYQFSDTGYAGGIVSITSTNCTISDCVNNGIVNTYETGSGLVAGFASGTTISNSINTGALVVVSTSSNIGSIIGDCLASASAQFASNNYYDSQVFIYGGCDTFDASGIIGTDTRTLTSGTPLEGLSADIYDFEAGAYPVLKLFKDEAAAKVLRHMILTVAENENVGELYSNATLSAYEGLSWSLVEGTTSVSISGSNLVIGTLSQPENTTVTAQCGDYYRPFDITIFNNPYEGAGTSENPYKINSLADMQTLSKYTTDYGARYNGKYFVMTADIDFKDVTDFKPIAWTGSNQFTGIFDGQNHKISNLTLKWDDKESTVGYSYVGLFGTIGVGGALRNMTMESGEISCVTYAGGFVGKCMGTVENCKNYATVSTSSAAYAGGLVGYLSAGNITNCENYGEITSGTTHAGGIVSYATTGSKITNCLNKGDVSTATGKNYAGGIAAVCSGNMIDCRNEGAVKGYQYVGGLAASISTLPDVKNCVNTGKITATTMYVGGIAGNATANVENCINYSDISGTSAVGGVFGTLASGSSAKNCINYGSVAGTKSAVGGITGTLNTATLDSCINYGEKITNAYYYTGGIAGQVLVASSEIRNCENHAAISVTGTSGYATGGIAGQCVGKIYDCLNYGDVSSQAYSTGGISGQGSGYAYRCINFGNVSSTYDVSTKANGNVGGIWGHGVNTINDCINYGNVTGKRYVGGIAGYPGSTGNIKRVYFSGVYSTETPSLSGVICHKASTMTKLVTDSCYYNSELNPNVSQSDEAAAIAIAKTPIEMMTAALGDAYDYHECSMPTLKSHANVPEANFMAVLMIYREGESADYLKTRCVSDLLPGLEWSATSNIIIKDGCKFYAAGKTDGEIGTVTLKAGSMSREYKLALYNGGTSSVDTLDQEREIISKRYFSIDGKELVSPEDNGIVIECIKYNDGTTYTRKVVVNRK
jgi:hypothetical protein